MLNKGTDEIKDIMVLIKNQFYYAKINGFDVLNIVEQYSDKENPRDLTGLLAFVEGGVKYCLINDQSIDSDLKKLAKVYKTLNKYLIGFTISSKKCILDLKEVYWVF